MKVLVRDLKRAAADVQSAARYGENSQTYLNAMVRWHDLVKLYAEQNPGKKIPANPFILSNPIHRAHPYMMRCVGECGGFTQHVQRAHSSGEKLWCCTQCGAWTLARPTRKSSLPGVKKNPIETASWVIREKATGKVLFETFDRKKIAALNTQKYEAVPIQQYLGSLNQPKKNPIADDVREARRLGREFSGHDPRRASRFKVQKPTSKVRLAVGEVTAIQYRARRDGRTDEYRHRFAKGSRPQLAVTPDGNHLELLGGAFRFTDRGIVDKRR